MPHPPQIPLTPQTDERNFPRWEKDAHPGKSGSYYPKMLTRLCTREDRDEWKEKNRRIDQNTRQEYFEGIAPRLNSPIPMLTTQEMVEEGLCHVANEPVIAQDKEDEARIRAFLGLDKPMQVAPTVSIPIREPEWIDEAPEMPARKRGGRPKGSKNKAKTNEN